MSDVDFPDIEERTFDDALKNLIRQVSKTLKVIGIDHPCYTPLFEACANVEEWADAHEDPRRDGWAGSDGRP
jgi:hypothetical protein